MTLEQSTVAVLSEIDRTLRSLGVREESLHSFTTPRFEQHLPVLSPQAPSRQASSAQTVARSSLSTGTQCCAITRCVSVQHGPNRHMAASQTDEFKESKVTADSLHIIASSMLSIIERVQLFEREVLSQSVIHVKRLEMAEKNARYLLNFTLHYKAGFEQKLIENQELSERMSLLLLESTARSDYLTAFHVQNAHAKVADQMQQQRPCNKSLKGKSVHPLIHDDKTDATKTSPHSSFDDLTELLDECWRALEE